MKTILPQNYVYVLRTTIARHKVSFIDFYFHLANFRSKLRFIRYKYVLYNYQFYMPRDTQGEPEFRGGGTPSFGLYRDVPLDRVCFFGLTVLNRVYNSTCFCPKQVGTCPKQGILLRAERL